MNYTKQFEDFYNAYCKGNYCEEQIFDQAMLPLYVSSVSTAHNHGNYEMLVKTLTKDDLKRVYKLIRQINPNEAKTLNQTFKRSRAANK